MSFWEAELACVREGTGSGAVGFWARAALHNLKGELVQGDHDKGREKQGSIATGFGNKNMLCVFDTERGK